MNQRGALTLDFVFALIVVGGISIVLLSLSFTLFVSQIGQYVAFATSRVYFAGHISKEKQTELAEQKFQQLMRDPNIRRFFGKGWFDLTYEKSDDFANEYSSESEKDVFIGTRLNFKASILNTPIPVIGSGDNEGAFSTKLTSFLGREPSDQECWDFIKERWNLIQALVPEAANLGQQGGAGDYVPLTDNGC